MIHKLEILCLALGLALGVACQNPPDDDDRPGQAPSSVEACDPDVERCEP